MDEEFPALAAGHSLRLTQRALDDLGLVSVAPGDWELLRKNSVDDDIIDKFFELRSEVPTGTEGPLRNVGRHDVYSLHGRLGLRAATWYDEETRVCWLLGVTRQHRYDLFESRAANGTLLPSEDDFAIYFTEVGTFEARIEPGLRALVTAGFARPWSPQRAFLGDLLKVEVSVVVEHISDTLLADVFISIRVPPLGRGVPHPPGWPGKDLVARLAELVTGIEFERLDCMSPSHLPNGNGKWRDFDPTKEVALVLRNIDRDERNQS